LRNAKDLPVVLLHQRLEGVYIPAPGTLDERYIRMHLLGCVHCFDGRALRRFQRNRTFQGWAAGKMQRLLFNFSKSDPSTGLAWRPGSREVTHILSRISSL
jgi:hypothetical protein